MPTTLRRLIAPLLALAFLGLLVVGLTRPKAGASDGTPLAGQPATDFDLATLDGGRLSLSQFRGRSVIVNFWASWCIPCRDEAPILHQAALDGADRGLVILGIAWQDTAKDARAFRDQFRLGFPVLLGDDATAVHYGLTGVPETFFIDRQGRIVFRQPGALTASVLEANLKKVLE